MTIQEYINLHGSVIVATHQRFEVLEPFDELEDDLTGEVIRQRFYVARIATREEFLAQGSTRTRKFYYEVRTD